MTGGYNVKTGEVAVRTCGGGKCAEDHGLVPVPRRPRAVLGDLAGQEPVALSGRLLGENQLRFLRKFNQRLSTFNGAFSRSLCP